MNTTGRTVIIGGPQCGESTYARSLGLPVFCGDPRSLVKNPVEGVTYLPEGLTWSQGSDYVMSNWFTLKSPCVIEGVSVVRALRKWKKEYEMIQVMPCDKIVYFRNQHPSVERLPGQDAMEKAIQTVWSEIATYYTPITVHKTWQ